MADRVTKVTLTAQAAQYIAEMDKAAKKTNETATAAQKLAKQGEAFEKVGRSALAIGTLAAVGFGLAVSKFAEFDEAMSNVKAATQETSANMGLLREAALEAGASTVFSATEAANAIEELGKAGLSTEDILSGGLNGALSLAAAGQLEVAEAAGIAAIAMKQFNLEGDDLPHVADLLAAGAGKAVGSVQDLAAALGQTGLVANGAGQSIEDTTGVLAAFADAGLTGSDAGTSLKAAIIALQAPTQKSRDIMEEYNLSFYDANGQMLSFDQIAGQLERNLGGLTQEQRNSALATIFGNDALRVANVLYDEGATGIRKYIDQTNDSGFAAKVAADRLDNLRGDVEKLGGAFDTALIQSGSGVNDMLRGLVQGATGVVDAIGSLPAPVLGIGTVLAGVVSAAGLVGGAALIAVPKIAQFKDALKTLEISGGGIGRTLGGITAAVGVASAAFAVWAQRQADVSAMTRELEGSLDKASGAMTDYTREVVAKTLAEKGVFKVAKEAGIGQKELTDAVLEGGDALKKVRGEIGALNNVPNFFTGLGIQAGDAGIAIDGLAEALPAARDNLEDQKAAADESADSTNVAADAYQSAADNAADLESNLQALIDTVNEANGVGQDAVSANLDYKNALADVDEVIRKATEGVDENNDGVADYTLTLDEATQAGRDNKDMLVDLAAQSQEAAEKQFALDGNTAAYKQTLADGQQALIDRATQLGYNADEAQILADKIYAIPSEAAFKMIVETAEAQRRLDAIASSLASFQGSGQNISAYVRNNADGGMYAYADGGIETFAGGGFPSGIYAGRAAGIHKFAEPETGWEAYVSGKPGMEERNRQILYEAGDRLGMWGSPQPVQQQTSAAQGFPAVGLQLLREIRDRVGVTVPTGAVQGALGASNVGNNTRGR